MDELKQKGFITWLSEIFETDNPEELDSKIRALGEDKLNELAIKFNNEVWPVMEKELKNQVTYAKLGSKLDYISRLNGECPEGYEVEKFMIGGKPCTRCKKRATVKMKKGSVMDDIRSEIEAKKCGGKAKKMQNGGKSVNYDDDTKAKYNEDEHARLIEAYQNKKIKQNSPQHRRLQQLNRLAPNQDPAWNPKKNSQKKSAPKLKPKKMANGGNIQFLKDGNKTIKPYSQVGRSRRGKSSPRPLATVGTSDPTHFNPKTEKEVPSRNYLDVDYDANIGTEPITITKPKSTKPNLGGGIYEWMVKNGMANRASYAGRKGLWSQLMKDRTDVFAGTAEQNAALLKALQILQTYNQVSNNNY